MHGKYLLDTDGAIALLRRESPITRLLQTAEIFLPVITVGELYFGAENSGRRNANRSFVDEFVEGKTILTCDVAIAQEYGRCKALLRRQGTPIPDNDVWIAAIALGHRLSLVTRDKHFSQIAELSAIAW